MGVVRTLHTVSAGARAASDDGLASHSHAVSTPRQGQAQSGGDGMSSPDDHEESVDAIAAAVQADAPHLRLTQVLGEGGMAVVFAGRHLTLDTPVAVKVARSAGPHRAELASRLMQEAKMYAALADAGAPRVLDARTLPSGTPYLVMERISGTLVADILERGPMEPTQALQILDGLLATLSALHAAGVVHRDVKPANIILEPLPSGGSRVRLIDFGVAKWGGGADGPFNMIGDAKATQVGTLVGTPDYVAPEQVLGMFTRQAPRFFTCLQAGRHSSAPRFTSRWRPRCATLCRALRLSVRTFRWFSTSLSAGPWRGNASSGPPRQTPCAPLSVRYSPGGRPCQGLCRGQFRVRRQSNE